MALRPDREAKLSLTFLDNSGETSNFTVYGDEVTAASFDARVLAMTNLRDATGVITRGKLNRVEKGIDTEVEADPTVPADPEAQREDKLVVYFHGNTTGHKHSVEIPTFDRTYIISGTEEPAYTDPGHVYTDVDIADFITKFQTFVKVQNPISGGNQGVTVDRLIYHGRNL